MEGGIERGNLSDFRNSKAPGVQGLGRTQGFRFRSESEERREAACLECRAWSLELRAELGGQGVCSIQLAKGGVGMVS